MSTLHTQRQTVPQRPPTAGTRRWRLVAGVVAVAAVLVAALVLLFGGDSVRTGSSGVRGSGVAVSESRTVPAFSAVELAGSTTVAVRVGSPQSVVVHADDNLVDRVRTTVRSGTLVIDTTGTFTTRTPMRVEVAVPQLTGVALSGSGTTLVDGVDTSAFVASLSGSGRVQVTGRTTRLVAGLPGSGLMDLHGLVAQDVTVRLSGSGAIDVHAAESLDGTVSGSGTVRYAGDPAHVTTAVTGSGTIQPR